MPLSAAVYIRVSTDEQAREGVSLEVQETECSARALALGATSVIVYADPGLSGMTLRRPQLQRLIADLDRYAMLVVWSVDRLARPLEDRLAVSRMLHEAGVQLVSLHEAASTATAADLFSFQVQGAAAEFEVNRTRERVVAALEHLARNEGMQTGFAPYGYNGSGRNVTVDPEKAETVREMFRRCARGETTGAITRWLNGEGIPSRKGFLWHHRMVLTILRSPFYLGKIRHRGEVLEGKHEPIVPAATWREAQKRLAAASVWHPRSRATSWSPLYRCGVCGSSVIREVDHHGRPPSYQCTVARRVPREQRHEPMSCTLPKADHFLWEAVADAMTNGVLAQAIAHGRARLQRQARGGEEAKLAEEVVAGEAQLAENLSLYHRGLLTIGVLERENTKLARVVTDARARLDALERRGVERQRLDQIESLLVTREQLEKLPGPKRRELLAQVLDRVEMRRNHLTAHWALQGAPPLEIPLPRYWGPIRGHGGRE